jgi:hypothetical protein
VAAAGNAREPRLWIDEAYESFVGELDRLSAHLARRLEVTRWPRCGGCAIELRTGAARATPNGWHVGRADVSGWLTAGDLIHRRLTGEELLGETAPGDYREGCRTCH